MATNPVLKEQKFQEEIAAARQNWGSAPPGAFGGSRGDYGDAAARTSFPTMTVNGTIGATAVLLTLLTAAAVFGYLSVEQPVVEVIRGQRVSGPVTFPAWMIGTLIAGIVLSIASSFKPKWARVTGPLYALCFGTVVGGISALYNNQYSGIVLQAVGATVAVTASMLFLYVTRIIKVTNRMRMIVMGATMGIMLLYVMSFVLGLAGVDIMFFREPTLLGIGISILIVGVAAFNLMLDFDFVERAVVAGSPKYMNWYGAFGITVTLVWLYLEILRLISLLNRR